jgi:hypothetical protein
MNIKAIVIRIKAVHWAWWLLWLGAMALLGLVVINHAGMTKRLGPDWAETFRPTWRLLPAHIIMLRDLTKCAGLVAVLSVVSAVGALGRPKNAPLCMAVAVGVILGFFWLYTSTLVMMFDWEVMATLRQGAVK